MTDQESLPEVNNAPIRFPLALRIVAWLFILFGVGALLTIADSLARSQLYFDFNVLGIFIGWGLLRRREIWRFWALVVAWIDLAGLSLICVAICFVKGPITATLFDRHLTDVPRIWGFSAALIALLITVWTYRVLTRADVRELFRRQSAVERNLAGRPLLMPIWFVVGALSLAVAQFVFVWSAEQKKLNEFVRSPASGSETIHMPGFESDPRGNIAIIADKTNSISISTDLSGLCLYKPGTDSLGRPAYISPASPKPIVFPLVENTLAIQLADGKKSEFSLPAGAAKRFIDEYDAGHRNSLLERAIGLFGPSEQRSRLQEFLVAYHEPEQPRLLAGFDDPEQMKLVKLTPNQAQAFQIQSGESHLLQVSTDAKAQWPTVLVEPKDGNWDLTDFDAATVDIENPEETPVRVLMNVNNPGADGQHHCSTDAVTVPARGKAKLTVPFGLWYGDPSQPIDLANVVSVSVGLDRPGKSRRFLITRIEAIEFDHGQIDAALADPFFQSLKPIFGRGMNFGNALEAPKEGDWGVTLKEKYFEDLATAGFNSVRIPVCWSAHAAETAPYTIDAKLFDRVDWAVRQALQRKLIPIVDMHHYGAMFEEPEKNRRRFLALWEQIAEHYKDFPLELALELLNEPHDKLTAEIWNSILADGLRVVRRTNPTRQVVVGPVGWNSIGELHALELPKDDEHLVVTVHYYSPFQFTHQGTEFSGPEAQKWLGRKWTGSKAEQQAVRHDFDTAISWAVKNRRPIYLGEFGVYCKADPESRARWIRFVADEAVKRKMGFAYWEFCSGFGVYDSTTDRWIEPLRDALLGKPSPK